MRIVLASASPSRRAILRSAGVDPLLAPAAVDEDAIRARLAGQPPSAIVAGLARAKARAVADAHPGHVIVGADSMLLLDGALQGKPHTVEETVRRWRAQAGRTAHLLSGHCIIGPDGRAIDGTVSTAVTFAAADAADIAAYAATGEPLECAGAFTLEALGGWFIERVDGDPASVLGLSLNFVREALYAFGLRVADFWESGTAN